MKKSHQSRINSLISAMAVLMPVSVIIAVFKFLAFEYLLVVIIFIVCWLGLRLADYYNLEGEGNSLTLNNLKEGEIFSLKCLNSVGKSGDLIYYYLIRGNNDPEYYIYKSSEVYNDGNYVAVKQEDEITFIAVAKETQTT